VQTEVGYSSGVAVTEDAEQTAALSGLVDCGLWIMVHIRF
jgi:hypothetical protein